LRRLEEVEDTSDGGGQDSEEELEEEELELQQEEEEHYEGEAMHYEDEGWWGDRSASRSASSC
jgi:hypothetical protein